MVLSYWVNVDQVVNSAAEDFSASSRLYGRTSKKSIKLYFFVFFFFFWFRSKSSKSIWICFEYSRI